jgi:hypothetical protein
MGMQPNKFMDFEKSQNSKLGRSSSFEIRLFILADTGFETGAAEWALRLVSPFLLLTPLMGFLFTLSLIPFASRHPCNIHHIHPNTLLYEMRMYFWQCLKGPFYYMNIRYIEKKIEVWEQIFRLVFGDVSHTTVYSNYCDVFV